VLLRSAFLLRRHCAGDEDGIQLSKMIVAKHSFKKADAMSSVCPFASKFASLISWSLSCFDRVIFKGHLPISRAEELQKFVDYVLKQRRCDFMKNTVDAWSERLVQHAKDYAARHGRTYEYYQGAIDKDAWAKTQRDQHSVTEGLIGILCVQETCPTFKLGYADNRPIFVPRKVPQRVLYYYFLDANLGLIHVRLQTWAPFTCQIYVNGHEFVARKLAQQNSPFEQLDNCFTQLGDPQAAQRLANRFVKLPWPKILQKYARLVNPLLGTELKERASYYWVSDQAEFATDLCFTSKHALAGLFQRLLVFALVTFTPRKIFTYLGRRWHERFDGEVQTRYRSEREPGACVKHYMKNNWLKMYDKLGLILRIETVINQPGEFKVFRDCPHRDGTSSTGYYPMRKGVGNLHHYQSHALLCNQRYLQALAVVDDPTPALDELANLTERRRQHGRSYAGFNPARQEEVRLFTAVLAGDHIAQGFRNHDIRAALHRVAKSASERRRHSAAVGRLLKRLHVRGLLAKVPHTRRWRVTSKGRRVLSDTLHTYRRYNTQAA
jgi:hypothetical protein